MKKKISLIGIVAIVVIISLQFAVLAEEKKEDKISTFVVLKNDFVSPQHGESYFSHTTIYSFYRQFGGGMDITYAPKNNYHCFQPFITLNKGPFYALAGYSGDSLGGKHFQAGAWFAKTHKKLSFFVDLRNFWAVSEEGIGYLDLWVYISHPIGKRERFFVGLETEYIHWWEKQPHNWYMIGPVVGVNITKNISLYVRPSMEWDIAEGTNRTFKIRTGIKFSF